MIWSRTHVPVSPIVGVRILCRWGTNNLNYGPNLLTDNKRYGVNFPAYTLSLEAMSLVGIPAEETWTIDDQNTSSVSGGQSLRLTGIEGPAIILPRIGTWRLVGIGDWSTVPSCRRFA